MILPIPVDAKPMNTLSFVQSYRVPPITEPTKLIGCVLVLAHKFCELTPSIIGVGFITIENACGVPKQVLENGVTTICAVIGTVELFVVVKLLISPLPMAGNPINGLLLVQLNTVPAMGEPVNITGLVLLNPHTTLSEIGSNRGIGSTII